MSTPYIGPVCGRPTSRKAPCAGRGRTIYHPACSHHITPEEDQLGNDLFAAWRAGGDYAEELHGPPHRAEVERLRQKIAELEARLNPVQEWRGRLQLVRVGRYTYGWIPSGQGDVLKVGDRVVLPGVTWIPGREKPWEAEVTGVGSNYTGELSQVIRRATDPAAAT